MDGRDPIAMERKEKGFHETLGNGLTAGARYMFALVERTTRSGSSVSLSA